MKACDCPHYRVNSNSGYIEYISKRARTDGSKQQIIDFLKKAAKES
jgi:hypothetical protein